jgi:hypothetical protein
LLVLVENQSILTVIQGLLRRFIQYILKFENLRMKAKEDIRLVRLVLDEDFRGML